MTGRRGFRPAPARAATRIREAYICGRLLAENRFDLRSLEPAVIRLDRGEPIEGLIVVAQSRRIGALSAAGDKRRSRDPIPFCSDISAWRAAAAALPLRS